MATWQLARAPNHIARINKIKEQRKARQQDVYAQFQDATSPRSRTPSKLQEFAEEKQVEMAVDEANMMTLSESYTFRVFLKAHGFEKHFDKFQQHGCLSTISPKFTSHLFLESKIGINDMSKRDELKRLGREHDAFKKKLNELKVSDEAKRAFYEQGVVTKGLLRREDVYSTHRVEVLMTRFKLSEKQAEELVTAAQLRRRVSVEHVVDPQGRGCWRVARKHKLIGNQTLLEEVQEAIDDTPDANKQTHDQLVGAPNRQFKPVTQTRKRRIEDALDEIQQMGGLDDVACPSPKPSTISPSL